MTRYSAAWLIAAASSVGWYSLGSAASASFGRSASLSQSPLVMRLSKDEFRIAFGLAAAGCASNGCNGVIRYRVDWKTDDGTVRSELRRVSYSVLPHYTRAITVDRQYFDTAEGAHTTAIVKVSVGSITCLEGVQPSEAQLAAINR
jgi:hypothetical protein